MLWIFPPELCIVRICYNTVPCFITELVEGGALVKRGIAQTDSRCWIV